VSVWQQEQVTAPLTRLKDGDASQQLERLGERTLGAAGLS
jgi:hypothetical protein